MNNTAIIILAAGASKRLGKPKQLLRFNNKTLLQHVVDEAVTSGAKPVIVVTGAKADEVAKDIDEKPVEIVYNECWEQGMASAIIAGIRKATALNHDAQRIIISVCDQPFVSANVFNQLYQAQSESGKGIVASSYAETKGTPVLFTQEYFDALFSLQGDEGAKKIIKANNEDVAIIDFPQGNIDIDTKNDYDSLLDKQQHVL